MWIHLELIQQQYGTVYQVLIVFYDVVFFISPIVTYNELSIFSADSIINYFLRGFNFTCLFVLPVSQVLEMKH